MEPNILLCGFGAFGQQHAIAWNIVAPKARLLVADVNPVARALALKSGCNEEDVAESYEDLISRADIMDIVTPSESHYSLALAALRKKLPTLIEKPAVKYIREAEELDALAKSSNTPVQVQFVLRAHPLVIKAKELLLNGKIGRLVAMDGIFTGWKRMRPDASILENDGVHMLDLMQFFADSEQGNFEISGDRLLGGKTPETIHLRLHYPDSVIAYLRLGIMFGGKQPDAYLAGSLTKKVLTLIGDQGSIEIDFNDSVIEVTKINYKETNGGFTPMVESIKTTRCPNITPVLLLTECFKRFLLTVENRADVICDLKQGAIQITGLLEKARVQLAK